MCGLTKSLGDTVEKIKVALETMTEEEQKEYIAYLDVTIKRYAD